MPYAVQTGNNDDSAVILCRDEDELADTNADCACGLDFNFIEAMKFGVESTFWLMYGTEPFVWPPVTLYKISEEEYEKWQRAFLPIS